jgi:hypothetical protein
MKNKLYLLVLLLGGTMIAQKSVGTIYGEKITLNSVMATVPANTDWNTLTLPGLYSISTVSNNGPTLAVTPNLILEVMVDGTNINQKTYTKDGTPSQIWMRSRNASTWSSWSRFLSDEYLASEIWTTNGNPSTTASNYIGTTDVTDFVTKTNNAERMRVTSGGNVGIGITPVYKLDVSGSIQGTSTGGGNNAIIAEGNFATINTAGAVDNKWWDFQNSGTAFDFRAVNDAKDVGGSAMTFSRTGTTINNVVFPNGNIGIGATSPTAKLEVEGGNIVVLGNNALQIKNAADDVIFTLITNTGTSTFNGLLNLQNNKITALADGADPTDAINKGQLDGEVTAMNTLLSTKIVTGNIIAGDGITVSVSGNNVTINSIAAYSNTASVTLTPPWVFNEGSTIGRKGSVCQISVNIYNESVNPTAGQQMMSLPSWAWPTSERYIPVIFDTGIRNAIRIATDGRVFWLLASGGMLQAVKFSATYSIVN